MSDQPARTISDMIDDDDLITEALRQGVREELLSQARAGNSVPIYENGQVVWLSPAEIYQRLGYVVPDGSKPS